MNQICLFEKKGPIAVITLNRPDVHNAISRDLLKSLSTAVMQAADDIAVRVVVLSGAGASFCAGADLNEMKAVRGKTFEQNVGESLELADVLKQIQNCPKPVVAVVGGAALGGGVGIVSACDIVLAHHDKAAFALSEAKLGLAPSVISPFVVSKIGQSQARRFFLTAERFTAATALHIGLVQIIYDDATRDQILHDVLLRLVQNGPEALTAIKNLLLDIIPSKSGTDLTQATAEHIAARRISAEGQGGLSAFFEKRLPNFAVTDTSLPFPLL